MKDISGAVEALRRFQVTFQALADAADVVESVAALEGRAAGLEKAAAAATVARDKAVADRAAAETAARTAADQAKAIVSAAGVDAAAVRARAQADYDALLARGKADGEAARLAALDGKKSEYKRIDTATREAMENLARINVEIRKADDERASLDKDIADRQAKLAQVKAAIAALKD
jgi:trimeric autotransporter adhesin